MTFFFPRSSFWLNFRYFARAQEQDDRWAVELSAVEQWGLRKLGQPMDEGVGKSQQQLME